MAATSQAPEDDDGNAAQTPKADITDHLSAIEASGSSAELAKVFEAAKQACRGDQALLAQVNAARDKRIEKAQKEKGKGANPLNALSLDVKDAPAKK
jgi:hypothetical protein